MALAPTLFVSHGAPTWALDPGTLGPALGRLGKEMHDVSAVLVVSPHWQTRGLQVMSTPQPPTVHDFSGFPRALHEMRYPAPGAPILAQETAALLNAAGNAATLDDTRGIDHGAWVPLRFLKPDADVPVFQASMPLKLTTTGALQLGRALAPLRERGVMIMGSGSLTHNLRDVNTSAPGRSTYGEPYVRVFTQWIREHVQARDYAGIVDYRAQAPHAKRAHPTEEHFLPLLVALGAAGNNEKVLMLDGGITYGCLAMEAYAFGVAGVTAHTF